MPHRHPDGTACRKGSRSVPGVWVACCDVFAAHGETCALDLRCGVLADLGILGAGHRRFSRRRRCRDRLVSPLREIARPQLCGFRLASGLPRQRVAAGGHEPHGRPRRHVRAASGPGAVRRDEGRSGRPSRCSRRRLCHRIPCAASSRGSIRRSPGTRSNSCRFNVATLNPCASAVAAIHRSCAPIICPRVAR